MPSWPKNPTYLGKSNQRVDGALKVTGKAREGGRRRVDCQIKGVNQLGKLMGVAEATLSLEN